MRDFFWEGGGTLTERQTQILLLFTFFVFSEPPKLDRHVNEPMISEMFNIIGLHINQKLRNVLININNMFWAKTFPLLVMSRTWQQ